MNSITVNSRDAIALAFITIPAIILLKLHGKSIIKCGLVPTFNFLKKQFSNRWKALLTTLALAAMYTGALTFLTGETPYELTTTYTTFYDEISLPIEQKDNVGQIVREKVGPNATDIVLESAGYNRQDNSISYQVNYTLHEESYPDCYMSGAVIFGIPFTLILLLPPASLYKKALQ